jgi:flagellar biosynthesis GTPase FlhF
VENPRRPGRPDESTNPPPRSKVGQHTSPGRHNQASSVQNSEQFDPQDEVSRQKCREIPPKRDVSSSLAFFLLKNGDSRMHMSYSDIVGAISGILQFVVACYALRVSRIFGIARVGWVFFGAFSLLAAAHVLLSIQPFGLKVQLGPTVINIMYEVVSVLLLANIAQMEALLWRRRQKLKADAKTQSEGELKVNQQIADLTTGKEAAQQTVARLQTEMAQLNQTLEQERQAHTQAALAQAAEFEKHFQEQLAASRKAEEELRTIAASLQAELAQQKQVSDQDKQSQELATKTYEELLTAARQSEAELQTAITALKTELQTTVTALTAELAARPVPVPIAPEEYSAPQPVVAEPVESVESADTNTSADQEYEEQLQAARETEEELRSTISALESELAEQKQKQEQSAGAYRELATSLRESGIAQVASLAQSRIGYIARITNLMREHSGDIGNFMTRHPRGKQLPNALSLMIEYLSDEQYLLLKRIDSVQSKLAKFTETSVQPANEPAAAPAIPANVEAPAQETHEAPAAAQPADAGTPGDFLSHLIENVTETGTEALPSEAPAAEDDAPSLLPDLDDLKNSP